MHEIHRINTICSKPSVYVVGPSYVYHGQKIDILRIMNTVSVFYWWIFSYFTIDMLELEFECATKLCLCRSHNPLKRIIAHQMLCILVCIYYSVWRLCIGNEWTYSSHKYVRCYGISMLYIFTTRLALPRATLISF